MFTADSWMRWRICSCKAYDKTERASPGLTARRKCILNMDRHLYLLLTIFRPKPIFMRKRLYLLLAFLWMGVCMLSAQTKNVSGRILSAENDEPIPGATVLVKGTSIGVVSDAHGHFTLKVPESATELIVSFMGMETQEVGIKANLTIRLKSANKKLDEVMVVAYGTAKKSSFTGAAEVIKNEQLEKMNVVSVTKALEGTSPGLQVMGGTGQPGSGAEIRIRGIGSLSSSSAPLYVLNGVVFDGDISSINPDDIESISVLKDAASAALYGARGANGVIMIQTKKGNAEKSTLSVKAVWGFSSRAIPEYSRIGIKDYYETSWEAYRNALVGTGQSMEKASEYAAANLINKQLGGYNNYNIPADKLIGADGKVDASARLLYHDNWGDALFRTGLKQDYMLSMSGGSDKTTYYLSLGWLDEEGIMTRTDYQRFTARANINSQFTDWFNLEGNMGYTNDKSNQMMQAKGTYAINPFFYSRMIAPIFPIYKRDEQGNYILDSEGNKVFDYGEKRPFNGRTNNLATLIHDAVWNQTDNFNINVTAGTKFLRNFTFKVSGSADILNRRYTKMYNNKFGDAANVRGRGSVEALRIESLTFNQILNFNKELGLHNVSAMVGHESYRYVEKSVFAQRTGFPLEMSNDLVFGAQLEDGSSQTDEHAIEGWFGQVGYDYANRYYISGSYRRDGSSRFYKDSRWGDFWSVGASWRISQEAFMKNAKWMDNLKLKVSYGVQGNDNILDENKDPYYYAWQNFFEPYPNHDFGGVIHSTTGNRDLHWEKNTNFNVGLEFSFLNRIRGEVDYFIRKGEDMLYAVPVPYSTGLPSIVQNAASMDNKGIELQLSFDILKERAFKWTLDLNLTHYKNKLTKLTQDEVWVSTKKWVEGGSIYDFWLMKWAGVDAENGDELWWYKNGDAWEKTNDYSLASKDPKSKQYVGSAIPKVYGGFTNNFSWKGLNLSVFFSYSVGGKMYDSNYQRLMHAGSLGHAWHKDILKRWRKPGDVTDVPRIEKGNRNISKSSNRFLKDASYLSLRNINLSYTLPAEWSSRVGMSSVKVFVSGDNLVTFTKLKGMDPTQAFSGVSDNTYVPNRVVSVGLNINF